MRAWRLRRACLRRVQNSAPNSAAIASRIWLTGHRSTGQAGGHVASGNARMGPVRRSCLALESLRLFFLLLLFLSAPITHEYLYILYLLKRKAFGWNCLCADRSMLSCMGFDILARDACMPHERSTRGSFAERGRHGRSCTSLLP